MNILRCLFIVFLVLAPSVRILAGQEIASVDSMAPTIFLAGDSTMADKPDPDYPERGWGQLLKKLVLAPAKMENHARNGRSSKSFIDEGLWDQLISRVEPGDWVIIQFGHNDEKERKSSVYAAPRGAYRDNLLRFIRETRERGASPVLATSVARRAWDGENKLKPTHGDYPAVVREIAKQEKVPLLDMEIFTTELEQGFGLEGSKRLHLWVEPGVLEFKPDGLQDNTHYSVLGARRVAALAADEIHRLKLPLARWVQVPDAVVAADGSGDYTSLEQAIYKAGMGTGRADRPWLIRLKAGEYRERVYVQRERGNIIVRGDDPLHTVITSNLHAGSPGAGGKPVSTFDSATVWIDGDGMVWEDVTMANTVGDQGPALALRADGDCLIFRRCRLLGYQDTVLVNRGRHYFEECYIEGRVDFIFGGATAYFSRCELHCLGSGYMTAASTPEEQMHGLVFADCVITGIEGFLSYLGRPWREFAQTTFLRTRMSNMIRPEGWDNWGKPEREATSRYVESGSTGPGAALEQRAGWTKRLTAEEAKGITVESVLSGTDHWCPVKIPTGAE